MIDFLSHGCTHIKTGDRYLLLAHALDTTNSRDGVAVVIYCSADDYSIYVRERTEFESRFAMDATP